MTYAPMGTTIGVGVAIGIGIGDHTVFDTESDTDTDPDLASCGLFPSTEPIGTYL